jgi:hypothetical protein
MAESPPNPTLNQTRKTDPPALNLLSLIGLTILAFLVMGYHPGLEDDAFYLAAIKKNLNPALFPHDSDFFRLQFQATIFDKLIALSVRLSHLPLPWVVLQWQLGAIFFVLHGVWRIARRCFSQARAQWAAVALVAALLTLPISGTGINLADQHLHPRTLATAAILAAIVAVMDSRKPDRRKNARNLWLAAVLLAVAFSVHAIMASFGISFCVFLWWSQRAGNQQGMNQQRLSQQRSSSLTGLLAFAVVATPFGWIFEPASDAWRQAASTRGFYFLSRWQWYEWLGVFAPIVLLFVFERFLRARQDSDANLLALLAALVRYGIFQTIVGLVIMLPPSLERLRPFEPMRYLHLLYLLFFLIVGGLLGQYILGRHVSRWLILFVPLGLGMFYAQRQLYPATAHIELPGGEPSNPWLEAFAWIRKNTPADSLFALDPHYVTLPGEDYHGFRALAERSVLADYDKDGGMAARVPRLAPRWLREVTAQTGWRNFQASDFQRLKNDFGVNWVILSRGERAFTDPQSHSVPSMTCPYQNQQIRVCRLY